MTDNITANESTDRIDMQSVYFAEDTGALGNDESISDDSEEHKAPDLIANIYQSMSKIIEALNTDNALLNHQVNKIRKELDFVCGTITQLRTNQEEMSSIYINEVGRIKDIDIYELRKKLSTLAEVQKHVMETRNMLMQTLDINMKVIKKEIAEIRNSKPLIRSIVAEEISTYLQDNLITTTIEQNIMSNLPNHVKKILLTLITDMTK